ncbi:MAG: hypothetical protein V4484_18590 [Pseudomonadota bacterium]
MRPPSRLYLVGALLAASWLNYASADTPPAPRLSGFGNIHRAITTRVPDAQFWFDQGLQQAYAFDEFEAVRAFKGALQADPACAMCAWGVAWQLGPTFNRPQRGDLSEARRYALMAQQLLPLTASPQDRELVSAMVTRYGWSDVIASAAPTLATDWCGSAASVKANLLDLAYAQQMHMLSDTYPDDPDLQSLFLEAQMITAPRAGYDTQTLQTLPRTVALINRVKAALRLHPNHTGLVHYYTHVADTPADAAPAARIGERLARLAPDAPHLLHMPSHLYVRLGRFADAVHANQRALEAQVRHAKNLEQQGFKLLKDWNSHNRRFLWVSAQIQGDGKTAMAMARELADSAGAKDDDFSQYLRAMPLLTMVHFAQWQDILKTTDTASLAPHVVAHARGLALARTGASADGEQQALEKIIAQTPAKSATLATLLLSPLKAEQAFAKGDQQAASAELRAALPLETDFITVEKALWAGSAQRELGQGLLRAGDFRGAEAAFRVNLQQLPGNLFALRGLHQALLGQGKKTAAGKVKLQWRSSALLADSSLRP